MFRKLWPRERAVLVGAELDTFLDGGQRNDVATLAHADQQPIDDRQRQRQAQRDLGALAGLTGDIDVAAQRIDRAPHHIHADTAAGDAGDLVRRREAGLHDELEQLAVGRLGAGREQPLFLGALLDARAVQAGTIIGNGDQHLVAQMARRKLDAALARLACRLARPRQLDAVVDRIADQMDQRVGQALDQRLVEFGVLARQHEFDFLAEFVRQVVYQAAEAAEQLADRHQCARPWWCRAARVPGVRYPRRSPSPVMSRLAPAICLRRDWAMTSSPTWSIRSSRRSAGTRMLPAVRAALGSAWTGAGAGAREQQRRAAVRVHGRRPARDRVACRRARTGIPARSPSAAARWSASRPSRHGTRSDRAPRSAGSRWCRRRQCTGRARATRRAAAAGWCPSPWRRRGRRNRSRQVTRGGIGGRAVGRRHERRLQAIAGWRRPRPRLALSGCSIRRRIWSFAASVTAISDALAATSPLRTRSNAVST